MSIAAQEQISLLKKKKVKRGRHANILTTIVNKEGHLQYQIIKQEIPGTEDKEGPPNS